MLLSPQSSSHSPAGEFLSFRNNLVSHYSKLDVVTDGPRKNKRHPGKYITVSSLIPADGMFVRTVTMTTIEFSFFNWKKK
jgi:hypothetical protein